MNRPPWRSRTSAAGRRGQQALYAFLRHGDGLRPDRRRREGGDVAEPRNFVNDAKSTSGLRRENAAAGADEEVGAEELLELADLLGHGRLGHAQRDRGRGEGAQLERRAEAPHLLQRQKLCL
jgi:hypothetical protein